MKHTFKQRLSKIMTKAWSIYRSYINDFSEALRKSWSEAKAYMEKMKDIVLKSCIKCKKSLTIGNFYNSKTSEDGKINTCKCCVKNKVKQDRQESFNPILHSVAY